MAVFIEREHSAPDLAAQDLRQHLGVVALIEAGVRPREFIEQHVDGTLPDRDAKQNAPARIAGQLPLRRVVRPEPTSAASSRTCRHRASGSEGRSSAVLRFDRQDSSARHGGPGGFRPVVDRSRQEGAGLEAVSWRVAG